MLCDVLCYIECRGQTAVLVEVTVCCSLVQARNQQDAEEGWYLMQEIIKAMDAQKATGGGVARVPKQVRILTPDIEEDEIMVGPALFGPDLGKNDFQVLSKCVMTHTPLAWPRF